MNKIKKCSCSIYTLKSECPNCGSKTSSAHPAKFSPEDKYGKYRRISQQNNGNRGFRA